MQPATVNLESRSGDKTAVTWTFEDSDGDPYDVSSWTWTNALKFFRGPGGPQSLAVTPSVSANEVSVEFDDNDEFDALGTRTYRYELDPVLVGDTDPTTVIVGNWKIKSAGSAPGSSTASATVTVDGTAVTVTITQTKLPFNATIKEVTSTTYTLIASDAGKHLRFNNASAITVTIPPFSSVAFAEGTTITGDQKGAGQVTFAAGSGVTIVGTGTKTRTQYSGWTLMHTEVQDTWLLTGDIL